MLAMYIYNLLYVMKTGAKQKTNWVLYFKTESPSLSRDILLRMKYRDFKKSINESTEKNYLKIILFQFQFNRYVVGLPDWQSNIRT